MVCQVSSHTVIWFIPAMSHFINEEMEAQRAWEVCTVSHTWEGVLKADLKPGSACFLLSLSCHLGVIPGVCGFPALSRAFGLPLFSLPLLCW